ncbi:MAG: hypothetical protein AAFO84_16305 [Cyanobacteria bacterium J06598_1]
MMNSVGLFEMLRHRILKEKSCGPHTSMNYLFAVFFGSSDDQGLQRFASVTQALEGTKSFENVVFTYCPSEALMSKFHVQSGSVVLFADFDEGRFDLPAGFSEAALCVFLETYSWPLVTRLTALTPQARQLRKLPCLYVFMDSAGEAAADSHKCSSRWEDAQLARALLEKTLQVIGARFRGVLQVVLVDSVDDPAGVQLAQDLGVSASELPMACVVEMAAPFNQYRSAGLSSASGLMAFVEAWASGWLEPFSPPFSS